MKSNFKSNGEFYKHLDAIAVSLRELGFTEAGVKITFLLHKVAWTTSSELFGELKISILELLEQNQKSLPENISKELQNCLQVIDSAWSKTR